MCITIGLHKAVVPHVHTSTSAASFISTDCVFLHFAKVLQSQPISKQCDVYSYGIVVWELLTHKIPFEDVSNYEITKKVVEEKEVSNFMILDFPRPFPTLIC